MSSEDIIEYEGRRFVRTGEVRPTEKGEFFWWAKLDCVRQAEGRGFFPREILRELPAETPALAMAQTPRCPKCESKRIKVVFNQYENTADCYECTYSGEPSEFFPESGLLAEAEEALRAFSDWGKECDNPRPSEAEIERQFQLFAKCRAVLARIRAAKEKP